MEQAQPPGEEPINITLTKDEKKTWYSASMNAGNASLQGRGKTPNEAVEDLMALYERHKARIAADPIGIMHWTDRMERLEKLVVYLYGRATDSIVKPPDTVKRECCGHITTLRERYGFKR